MLFPKTCSYFLCYSLLRVVLCCISTFFLRWLSLLLVLFLLLFEVVQLILLFVVVVCCCFVFVVVFDVVFLAYYVVVVVVFEVVVVCMRVFNVRVVLVLCAFVCVWPDFALFILCFLQEKFNIASDVGVAALVGETTYNFGMFGGYFLLLCFVFCVFFPSCCV